ncbi:D-alanine--D-alanine ligase-like [Clytia hemisphaerica]|uniref:D-alanine--D-alanine ligase-like n=1 Tax=Clytia hemisphaerica TaxID=252671 RepID=UPI0034D525E0
MQDKMLRVAVIEGGYSKEKDISVKSAQGVFENLDLSKYLPTRVYIDDVEWTAYDADGRYPINKNDFSFIHKDNIKITFDVAFILVHGTPGEDGKLQGYFDMIGIPYTTSSAVVTTTDEDWVTVFCFVKPTDGGSSYGVTKVKEKTQLQEAISLAFKHGSQVMIESFVGGREITNGVYRKADKQIKVLPITEIITDNEFFDYEAKYEGKVDEVTPADLDDKMTMKIKTLTQRIYDALGMRGVVRIDYIINDVNNEPHLIEINNVPGQSAPSSIIPQMARCEQISLHELYGDLIQASLNP